MSVTLSNISFSRVCIVAQHFDRKNIVVIPRFSITFKALQNICLELFRVGSFNRSSQFFKPIFCVALARTVICYLNVASLPIRHLDFAIVLYMLLYWKINLQSFESEDCPFGVLFPNSYRSKT